MIRTVGPAVLGLLAGLVARAMLPRHPAVGLLTTALLGSAGGWLAALAGEKLGLYRPRDRVVFLVPLIGATALLLLYSLTR